MCIKEKTAKAIAKERLLKKFFKQRQVTMINLYRKSLIKFRKTKKILTKKKKKY